MSQTLPVAAPASSIAPGNPQGAPPRLRKAPAIALHIAGALRRARPHAAPYRHWIVSQALPESLCRGIDALPFAPPAIDETAGRRETHNSTRQFFGVAERAQFPVCRELTQALQSQRVVHEIETLCAIRLRGSFLRVEYCQDTEGFWLAPHTDIGAKRFTMLIYLSAGPGCAGWGTDLCNPDGSLFATMPYQRNEALIFVPGADTWHGFHRRSIAGVRRSLIVNYVGPEWRARHELAFPDCPLP